MARAKPTDEDIKEREQRASEIKDFCKNHKFTEVKLAEIIGVSRRTIQMMKAGLVTPHPGTLHKLETLFLKYKREGK